ncbi:HYR domain-containing protein [Marivirga tractuosa]|uniref:HYR domain-containing protein n=1 Tax=Marivirga tractuosa TaxID=1006 RepID=UPI0035CFD082
MNKIYHQTILILLLIGCTEFAIGQCIESGLLVSDLDGNNGFEIKGNSPGNTTGFDVNAVGDINGDGFDDVIVSAHKADQDAGNEFGEVYAVFGTSTDINPSINVSSLNGDNGFVIQGTSTWSGREIGYAGDINNDGIDDFMISSIYGNPTGESEDHNAGTVHVIYGKSSGFSAELSLDDINGANGFMMSGVNGGDLTGLIVGFAGDVNGDNIDDLIIGAPYAEVGSEDNAGRVFVVFGRNSNFPAVFELSNLNGTNGFNILGDTEDYYFGISSGSAGDFNDDGIDDILLSESGGRAGSSSGNSFIFFGSDQPFNTTYSVSDFDGEKGFMTSKGRSSSALGDFNNDGIDDVVVTLTGSFDDDYYILFGDDRNFEPVFDISTLNGTKGFILTSNVGSSMAAGDFNNDGISDLVIGDTFDGVYVYLGRERGFDNFHFLDDESAFHIENDGEEKEFGYSLDGNFDYNGDGISDLLVGAPSSYASFEDSHSGAAYVFFGFDFEMDTEPPVIECMENQILEAGEALPDYTNLITITDDCDDAPEVTQSPAAGTTFTSDLTVTITATDDSYQTESCTFEVTEILDTEAPEITCPTDQIVACDATEVPDYTDLITVTDDRDADPTVTQSPAEGTTFTDGMTISMTAEDEAGNSSSCTFTVSREEDTAAPSISCPEEQSLIPGENLSDYTAMASATDDCDPDPVITQSPAIGTEFTTDITVTLTATDESGNTKSCTFEVTEIPDTEAPEITCPTDQIVACDATEVPDYTNLITVTDDRDADPTITQSPAEGTVFTDGMTISITAEDEAGNSSSCTFTVRSEEDTEAPSISCPEEQSLIPGENLPDYTDMTSASDDCDPDPVITQSPAIGTEFTTDITVTLTATDESGNTKSCTFEVTEIPDTEAPEITCPTDQIVACDATEVPDFTALVTATDNRDVDPTVTQSPAEGTVFTDGITINMTAEDEAGNTSSCTFTVSREEDNQAPSISCPEEQSLIPGENLPDYTALASVSDDCDPNPVITQSPAIGTEFTTDITVTLTATDESGNTKSCTFEVTEIPDTEAPEITCLNDQIVACDATEVPDFTALVTPTDDRDVDPTITQSPAEGTVFTDGMTISMTAEDEAGNSSSCSFTVSREEDTAAPSINCPEEQSLIPGENLPDYIAMASVTDDCDSDPVITQSPAIGTEFTTDITVTLTATDESGNTKSCTFEVIERTDFEAPEITCLSDQEVECTVKEVPNFLDDITVSDNQDENPVLTQSPEAGTELTQETKITISATDASGNSSECSIILQINAGDAPVFTCLPDQDLQSSENCEVMVPDFTELIEAESVCSEISSITQIPEAGTMILENTVATVIVEDSNGSQSTCDFNLKVPESLFPEVDAGTDTRISIGESHQLDVFTSTKGTFSWSPSKGLSNSEIPDPIASPEETTTYTVTFTSMAGCVAEDEITIEVEKVIIPKGFSPDYDGINDTWVIGGIENYPDNEVIIKNRWGNIVFAMKSYNNTSRSFDGNANRNNQIGAGELPEGTYFYTIQLDSKEKPKQGFIVLKK